MAVEGDAGYARQTKGDEAEGRRNKRDEETEQPIPISKRGETRKNMLE